MELMCYINWMLFSSLWMTKMLSTFLSQNFGVEAEMLMALVFKSSMISLATMTLMGDKERGVFKARLQQCCDVFFDMEVLWCSCVSYS